MRNIIIKNPSVEFDFILNSLNDKNVYFIDNTSYTLRMQGQFVLSNQFITIKKGKDKITFLKESIVEIKKIELSTIDKNNSQEENNNFDFILLNGNYFSIVY